MSTKSKGKQVNYEYRGMLLTASMVKEVIEHVHKSNLATNAMNDSGKKVPVCIWGKHGIGKTSIPAQIAKEQGIGYRSIAPAQFEEMGDLMGMPGTGVHLFKTDDEGVVQRKLIDKDLVPAYINQGWERDTSKSNQMIVSPPQFVPNVDLGDPEEGFFVIDDFNRASGRIINGIMQLLQDGELDSWALPKGWTIVLTANPAGADYQVTDLDDAQLTRMTHISMEFDAKLWAKWALQNGIDQRVVNFVLSHPETVKTGELTTPRTIEYFANSIRIFDDLSGTNLGMVNILGEGVLDKTTATQFTTFINNKLTELVTPEAILNSKNAEDLINSKIIIPFTSGNVPRVDVLNVLSTRLVLYCSDELQGALSKSQLANLKTYLKTKRIPNDIRFDMAQELIATGRRQLEDIMTDPSISTLILERM